MSETLNAALTTANRERGGNQIQMWRAKTRAEKRKRALAKQGEAPGGDAASVSGAGKAGGKAGGGKAGGRGSKGGVEAKVRREAGGLGSAPSPFNQDSSTGLEAPYTHVSSKVTCWFASVF